MSREEQQIKELGYASIIFDEKGKMYPDVAFTGQILIGEFERAIVKEMVKNIKGPLDRFQEEIEHLFKS